jgi:formylglycine-generating enzyme required for sulfatase activity
VSRLFISHSSKDNVAAKAFKQWLDASGWPDEDVFLDLDDIGAGERWKEALRKANARCEAVVLLASPDALSSPECLAELRKAEDYGKEVIVVLLRDVQLDDRRLVSFQDRQIVNLASPPQSHTETVLYRGEKCEVCFNAEALASVKEYLFKRGITPDRFAWPPADRPDAAPFPGLTAFTEFDAGIFFGRDTDILRGLDKLRIMRRNVRPRVLVIQAASGAGKSSYLRAGIWPRLERDPDFFPVAILRPAQGILTGPDGIGRRLAALLSQPARPLNPGEIHAQLMAADQAVAAAAFTKLMSKVAALAFDQRSIGNSGAQAPALVLAIDQAEELFASEDQPESERFLFMLAQLLSDPPPSVEPFAIFTIRADRASPLFEITTERKLEFPETLPLLPLPQTAYREVILKPLEVIARRGQTLTISAPLADRLVQDATGADALPLLAFTLSHLYGEYGAGGKITLDQYEAMGGVAGSIDMALKRALSKPGTEPAIPATKDEQLASLRSAFIPWLARVDPATALPIRRVARIEEIPVGSRAIVARLVDARLLVADRRSGADIVDVAHESLLRQWPALMEWLKADAADLQLVDAVERAAGEWARNGRNDAWLDHRAERLRAAERVSMRPDFRKRLGDDGLTYIAACRRLETAQRRKKALAYSLVGCLSLAVLAVLAGLKYQRQLQDRLYWLSYVHTLTAAQERALKPLGRFKECGDCPEMVVAPAGSITMGSLVRPDEQPPHPITIPHAFAVGRFEVTFAEWDSCATYGGCPSGIPDRGWGRDTQPVINVSWKDAEQYVAWLNRVTGANYQLLSEAQWEYAARAGSHTFFSFGNDDAQLDKYAWFAADAAGSKDIERHSHPVGQKIANAFGLFDMQGNVSEWVEDCYHATYQGAPPDGSAWTTDNCLRHVVRGGSFLQNARQLRTASRDWHEDKGSYDLGFRVARQLNYLNSRQ